MNFSKHTESKFKPILVYNDPKEMEPFSKIVVPPSMRSPLWRYFGFPANENSEVITKTRIICCLCNANIAYNKNTTNLKTHLSCKHPEKLEKVEPNKNKQKSETFVSPAKRFKASDQFEQINWYSDSDENQVRDDTHPTGITRRTCVQSGKSSIAYKPKFNRGSSQIVVLNSVPNKRIFDDFIETDDTETEDQENVNQYIETIDYNNIDLNEDGEIIAEVLEADVVPVTSQSKDDFLGEEFTTIAEHNEVLYENLPKETLTSPKLPPKIANKTSVKPIKAHQDSSQVMQQITKFLIKDLISPNIVDGAGFKEMIESMTQCTELPTSTQIEKFIDKDYNSKHSVAINGIKSIINNQNYSLSFHKLGNSAMVEISVNYWSDIGNEIVMLQNQIFCISKNCTNFVLSSVESLKRCSAFVVDFDLSNDFDGIIPEDIPIIPTFSFVTKMAFDECMQLSALQSAIDAADEFFMGKFRKSHTWLQQFEYLTQFINESPNTENNQIIQVLVECLQPLKNCLDVLAFETSIYASIMKPVVLQLINQHYADDDNGIDATDADIAVLKKDLKQTIYQIFQQQIIENPFLTMASFLDPRFQSLTAPDDLTSIRKDLEKTVQNDDAKGSEVKAEKVVKAKNVGLSSLFSNISQTTKTKAPKNRFDIEFRSYTEDVSLNMELCPLEWWFENDSLYPTMKQQVKKYFCVPAFVSNFHRMPIIEQEELEGRYDRIANDTNERLLWLHLNEIRQTSPES